MLLKLSMLTSAVKILVFIYLFTFNKFDKTTIQFQFSIKTDKIIVNILFY